MEHRHLRLGIPVALLLLLVAALLTGDFWEPPPRFTRSECIVHVHVDYAHPTSVDRDDVVHLLTKMWTPADRSAVPADALAMAFFRPLTEPLDGDPFVQVVYHKDCDRRVEMTLRYIDHFERLHPGLVTFSIDADGHQPNLRGDCFSGRDWIDSFGC